MAKTILSDFDFASGAKITGLPTAVAAGQPVVFEQLAAAIEGIAWKDNARVASQVDITIASPGAAIDGVTMAANDRVLLRAQSSAIQCGLYIWVGAAVPMTRALDASTFAELESAVVTVDEGTSAGVTYRQTQVNGVIDTNNVIWSTFGTSAPSASETVAGVAELATQAETDTGTDDLRAVTPLKLATHAGRKRKLSGLIGDGSATQFDITHNFNTRDVHVEIYRNSGLFDTVLCDVGRNSVNIVRLNFTAAPTASQFAYVIIA